MDATTFIIAWIMVIIASNVWFVWKRQQYRKNVISIEDGSLYCKSADGTYDEFLPDEVEEVFVSSADGGPHPSLLSIKHVALRVKDDGTVYITNMSTWLFRKSSLKAQVDSIKKWMIHD